MPTREQLVAAGRQDLVAHIIEAGGFLEVRVRTRTRTRISMLPRPCYHIVSEHESSLVRPDAGDFGGPRVVFRHCRPETAVSAVCRMPDEPLHLRYDSHVSRLVVQVAQQLGFRSRRRPVGYWDNEDNLDREIAQFVAANWTHMETSQPGSSYWYNQVPHPHCEAGLDACAVFPAT